MADNDDRDKSTGRFKPGKSGNPSGVSKKADKERDHESYYARRDGWASALTGIGDSNRDKRMSHGFVAPMLTYTDVIELWRGDDIARRAIEAVPRECLREGYELTISDEGKFDDLKDEVEQKMLDLKVNENIFKAFCCERAYGGAAILIGANDGRALDVPMEAENVRSIDWLKVLEPIELQPYKHYSDPTKAKYGEISHYQLTQNPTKTAMGDDMRPLVPRVIHESRLIVFPGLKVSEYQSGNNMTNQAWGDSSLIALVEVLRDFNVAWHGAGIIATDFAQPVLSMENLMQLVAKEPTKVAARTLALEMQRSNARAVLIDTKEKYERQSTSIAGLPDLLNQLSMRLSAAIDMPLSLLMGQTPGLGQDSSSDVRFYYDRIRGTQKEKIGPILRKLMSIIMRTIRQRKLPKRWSVRFNPLWQLTDQEKAEARLAQARVDSMYIKMGAVTCDEIRISRFGGEYSWDTQIEENKPAPGIPEIELALKQAEMQAEAMAAAPAPGGSSTKGTAGRGRVQGYARRNPTGAKAVVAAAKEGGDVSPATRDHADGDVIVTLLDCAAARERAKADGKLTAELDELISEVEEMLHEDEEISHILYGGKCPSPCVVCTRATTPTQAKTDLEDVEVENPDVEICPSCGDMMVGEHECGAADPKEKS